MDRVDDLAVYEYLEKLAAPDFPGPASGSAVATVAAMAASLLEMAYKVTIKKGAEHIPISLKDIENVRHQCLALATEDMKALEEVVKAAKLKAAFPDQYEKAMRNATEPLVSIVKNSETILTWIYQFIHVANKRVLGELVGSAHMAEAAAAAAKDGAEVNLTFIQDESYVKKVRTIVRESYRNSMEMKQQIQSIMNRE